MNLSRNYSSILPAGWNASDVVSACDWPRVVCDVNQRIVEIRTSDPLTDGPIYNTTIPAAYGLLSNLKVLLLNGGGYYGTIPPQLFTPNLLAFWAFENALWGAIPPEIANSPLSSLCVLLVIMMPVFPD